MASTINAKNTSTGIVITPDASGQLELQTADTTRMTIDVNGNVGIGTNSPSKKLDVNGSINANGIELGLNGEAIKKASGALYIETGSANPIIYSTNSSERMRINSSGNVGIGVTNASLKLEVAGDTQFSGWTIAGSTNGDGRYPPNTNIGIAFAWNFTGGGRDVTSMNNDTLGGGFRWEQRTGTSSSTFIGRTTNAGAWFKGDNSSQWATTSDARIKTNIREIGNALDKINALHPCHFEYVDKIGKTKTGFIAQEFEQVLAGHVITEEFVPEVYRDLIPEDDGIKGIDADLIPYLTKAIQELKAIIDAQAERIAVLENK